MLSQGLRAAAGNGPLSLTYITAGGSTSNLTTYTFNSVSFGSEHPSREIFIPFGWGSSVGRTVSSVTIGGVTATLATNFSLTTSGARCAFATVPTGTTGTVVFTFSGSCDRMYFSLYRVINRATRGQNETDSDGDGISSKASPLSVNTVTIPGNGIAFGAAGVNVNNTYSSNVFTIDNYFTGNSAESAWGIQTSYVNPSASATTPTQSISWPSGTIGIRYGYWAFNR